MIPAKLFLKQMFRAPLPIFHVLKVKENQKIIGIQSGEERSLSHEKHSGWNQTMDFSSDFVLTIQETQPLGIKFNIEKILTPQQFITAIIPQIVVLSSFIDHFLSIDIEPQWKSAGTWEMPQAYKEFEKLFPPPNLTKLPFINQYIRPLVNSAVTQFAKAGGQEVLNRMLKAEKTSTAQTLGPKNADTTSTAIMMRSRLEVASSALRKPVFLRKANSTSAESSTTASQTEFDSKTVASPIIPQNVVLEKLSILLNNTLGFFKKSTVKNWEKFLDKDVGAYFIGIPAGLGLGTYYHEELISNLTNVIGKMAWDPFWSSSVLSINSLTISFFGFLALFIAFQPLSVHLGLIARSLAYTKGWVRFFSAGTQLLARLSFLLKTTYFRTDVDYRLLDNGVVPKLSILGTNKNKQDAHLDKLALDERARANASLFTAIIIDEILERQREALSDTEHSDTFQLDPFSQAVLVKLKNLKKQGFIDQSLSIAKIMQDPEAIKIWRQLLPEVVHGFINFITSKSSALANVDLNLVGEYLEDSLDIRDKISRIYNKKPINNLFIQSKKDVEYFLKNKAYPFFFYGTYGRDFYLDFHRAVLPEADAKKASDYFRSHYSFGQIIPGLFRSSSYTNFAALPASLFDGKVKIPETEPGTLLSPLFRTLEQITTFGTTTGTFFYTEENTSENDLANTTTFEGRRAQTVGELLAGLKKYFSWQEYGNEMVKRTDRMIGGSLVGQLFLILSVFSIINGVSFLSGIQETADKNTLSLIQSVSFSILFSILNTALLIAHKNSPIIGYASFSAPINAAVNQSETQLRKDTSRLNRIAALANIGFRLPGSNDSSNEYLVEAHLQLKDMFDQNQLKTRLSTKNQRVLSALLGLSTTKESVAQLMMFAVKYPPAANVDNTWFKKHFIMGFVAVLATSFIYMFFAEKFITLADTAFSQGFGHAMGIWGQYATYILGYLGTSYLTLKAALSTTGQKVVSRIVKTLNPNFGCMILRSGFRK